MDSLIDLRSDTFTKPSPEMREAMAAADVGDDVWGEDPTVNALQEYAAALFAKEAALFVSSGTMGNLLALLALARPGESVILSAESHPYVYEGGNFAMFGGLMPRPIPDTLGKISPEQLRHAMVLFDDAHFSPTTLCCIENTTNRGGGAVYSVEEVAALAKICRENGLKLHCDGARIFNAITHSGAKAQDYGIHCDTLSFCLSKGLGAPVGSILVGDRATIKRAHRFRKMLGGGMRQAGILAAAGLYALQHHVEDLREDHRRAREFCTALESQGCHFSLPSPTNIVYLQVNDAYRVVATLIENGVLAHPAAPDRIRFVFHRDIDDKMLKRAISVLIKVVVQGN